MKQYFKKLNNQSGFTLIELLVVVTIIGIVSMVAIGTDMSPKAAVGASAKEILVMMQAARMEAIKTGRDAIIERTSTTNIRVYIDENGDKAVNSGDRLTADFDLTSDTIMPNELQYISYNNRGYLVNASNSQISTSILVCGKSKSEPNQCKDLNNAVLVSAGLSGIPALRPAVVN